MRAERFDFPNGQGHTLAALLERPSGEPAAYALFAHCFTCGKDNLAAKRIAQTLAERGIAVLRFDFTGLGASEGEFANTNFSSNVDDLVAAADHLRRTARAPALLIGHSLGGAAVLAAAARIPEAKAVATIAAPSDPGHVSGLFNQEDIAAIRAQGEREVVLSGRPFRIRREFLDDVAEQKLLPHVTELRRALLVLHAPTDDTVGIDNATRIFLAARHPKSFVSLADADHLLSRRRDAIYAAHVIAAWAERYVETAEAEEQTTMTEDKRPVVVTEKGDGKFQQSVVIGPHHYLADEPVAVGGLDTGPSPYEWLIAGLGACTAMTLRLYAAQKKLPLERVTVTLSHAKIHAEDCATCDTKEGMLDRIERTVTLEGTLDAAQRARLLEIADRCPVHRTLTSEIDIRTTLAT
ncbi:MAG TPA: bifunctional alpha/beta hydrolase/OsmC family protein [Xanthobacteraceae bacterium]|nr:bifunctional alpha/beta hydrolase/OsmC family protein [Xanthobacteraceae bacterium]